MYLLFSVFESSLKKTAPWSASQKIKVPSLRRTNVQLMKASTLKTNVSIVVISMWSILVVRIVNFSAKTKIIVIHK